jgi:excisionase family DNA binding protein
LLDLERGRWLTAAYRLLARTRNAMVLQRGRPMDVLPTDHDELETLARALRTIARMQTPERSQVVAKVWRDERPPRWVDEPLLRSGQVALLFQVSRRTVSDWSRAGRLPWVVTPGGHRRFRLSDVRALVESVRVNA